MRHKFGYKKLNRTSEHRKALIKNMLNSLIKYEQITTTLPKAKVLKPQADKIITLGKKNNLQNTKILASKLQDMKSANKVKKTLAFGNVVVICSYLIKELSIFFIKAFRCSDVLFNFLYPKRCLIKFVPLVF